ncbi:hypothetical protein DFH27DRAFT_655606 [Peziza echinospora]|nr:hypothetical protein DFH27DRAFT_655606 [Peziza echinospora]
MPASIALTIRYFQPQHLGDPLKPPSINNFPNNLLLTPELDFLSHPQSLSLSPALSTNSIHTNPSPSSSSSSAPLLPFYDNLRVVGQEDWLLNLIDSTTNSANESFFPSNSPEGGFANTFGDDNINTTLDSSGLDLGFAFIHTSAAAGQLSSTESPLFSGDAQYCSDSLHLTTVIGNTSEPRSTLGNTLDTAYVEFTDDNNYIQHMPTFNVTTDTGSTTSPAHTTSISLPTINPHPTPYTPYISPTSHTSHPAITTTYSTSPSPPYIPPTHYSQSAVKKRSLNTEAARRYRQKRVDRIAELEELLKKTEGERDALGVRVARLEGEVGALRLLVKKPDTG